MSEAGASIVDESLGLNIVPKTRVVRLTSPSFHYSSFDRARAQAVKSASKNLPDTVRAAARLGVAAVSTLSLRSHLLIISAAGLLPNPPARRQVGKHLRQGLPPKVGSFQTFVKGYIDASVFLRNTDLDSIGEKARQDLQVGQRSPARDGTPLHTLCQTPHPCASPLPFQRQFEYLVCLDYITRNTDRGNDNWLIKHTPVG